MAEKKLRAASVAGKTVLAMAKEYKNWKYIQQTPAFGQVYHHIKRRTILVIYKGSIRLYKDIPEFKDENVMMYPCHAETLIERRGIFFKTDYGYEKPAKLTAETKKETQVTSSADKLQNVNYEIQN